jgi:osmotically-inducible protein OsmY
MALTAKQKAWRRDMIIKGDGYRGVVTIERYERYFGMTEEEISAAMAEDRAARLADKVSQKAMHIRSADEVQEEIDAINQEEA